MASKNGITRAVTSPMEHRPASTDPERGFGTKGLMAAYDAPTPRERTLVWGCAGHPAPEVFYPTDEPTLAEAKAVCAPCPSRAVCLGLGRTRGEWGVWGGVLLEAGKPLDKPRAPGRPKKIPATPGTAPTREGAAA